VVFEDLIGTGGTACDLAKLLKGMGARSVMLFATSGLFSTDLKKGEPPTASVGRIDRSQLDAVFITDTFDHSLTDPDIHRAIEESPIIHTIKTAPYLASIIGALHAEVGKDIQSDRNSISAILKGTHPDQMAGLEKITRP
jgi:phosphoribosylpyrophosphate synthetase